MRLWNDVPEERGFLETPEDPQRAAAFQALEQLVGDAGRSGAADLGVHRCRGIGKLVVEPETQSRRILHGPHHPHGVLVEPQPRRPDRPDDAGVEVGEPTHVVYHGEVRNVVEETVDREVPAPGVLLRRAVLVGIRSRSQDVGRLPFLDLGRVGRSSEGRHLNDL